MWLHGAKKCNKINLLCWVWLFLPIRKSKNELDRESQEKKGPTLFRRRQIGDYIFCENPLQLKWRQLPSQFKNHTLQCVFKLSFHHWNVLKESQHQLQTSCTAASSEGLKHILWNVKPLSPSTQRYIYFWGGAWLTILAGSIKSHTSFWFRWTLSFGPAHLKSQ